jgi:tetrapyrrole methylase family protein / MazG family protein
VAARIVVVGLGPGPVDLVTPETHAVIERVERRFVRTRRHPSAVVIPADAESFDGYYDDAGSFDEVYSRIAGALIAAAQDAGDVLYAVPGSPRVLERSVDLLLAESDARGVAVEVLPAVSFLDLAWARLGVDPFADGVRLVDGHRFAERAAGERGPLLVAHCHANSVLSDIKLAYDRETPERAVVLHHLGLDDEQIIDVAWADIDRAIDADHLTTLWIAEASAPVGAELVRFAEVVRRLREECPWDRQQTHESLVRYVIEETYEVVEAIASGDPALLEEELGDLMLQVFLHSAIAAQAGDFTIADVAHEISEKMVRRHPHVFGDVVVTGAAHVASNWEQIKAAEKGRPADHASALDGVSGAMPALAYASELSRKAAKVGFDWDDAGGVWQKLTEELDELRAEPDSFDEFGDVLFVLVSLARHLGHDAEGALRAASAKFRNRFEVVEELATARGIELQAMTPATADALWDEAKARVAGSRPT